jgi:hypothetical protein
VRCACIFSRAFERVLVFRDVQQAALSSQELNFGFIVLEVDSADILVDISGTRDDLCVKLSPMDQLAPQYRYERLRMRADPEEICRVLRGAVRWHTLNVPTTPVQWIG